MNYIFKYTDGYWAKFEQYGIKFLLRHDGEYWMYEQDGNTEVSEERYEVLKNMCEDLEDVYKNEEI